jgi:hypothetical protein
MNYQILLRADKKHHKRIINWANVIIDQEVLKTRLKDKVVVESWDKKYLSITGEQTDIEKIYWFCLGMRMDAEIDDYL